MSPLPALLAAVQTPHQLTLITSTLTHPSTFLLQHLLTHLPATTPIHLLSALSPPITAPANLTLHTTPASLTAALAAAPTPPLVLIHEPGWELAAHGRSAADVLAQLRRWHQDALATVVFAAADAAVIAETRGRLERETRALVVALGHQAGVVVGVRGLATGWARDVGGVLDVGGEEWLYRLRRGGVEVFARGEMRG